jgi:receptor protein-tyrosine kinase
VVTYQTTPRYESEALLFAATPITDTGEAYQGSLFSEGRVASYVDLVDSVPVAEEVIGRLGLTTSVAAFRDKVTATVVPDTVLLKVMVSDSNPQDARVIANTTASVFVDYVNELEQPRARDAISPVTLTIVNPAVAPGSPVSPDPLRNIGIAVLLGLILGVGAALLRQAMDHTIRNESALEEVSRKPLLGSIPRVRAATARSVSTGESSDARAEPLRKLRTNLRHIGIGQRSRVFVVASAMDGEGKTSTAVNLAVVMGKADQRVVLVEGDLRRPRIADYLPLGPSGGLTAVLQGSQSLDDALQQPHLDTSLHVLTGGSTPPNPAELLQSDEMAAVVKQLRDLFDVVIIDVPPLLAVTDGALLASLGDATILVLRYGKTTEDQLRRAVHQLEQVDARLAGTVMTMVPRGNAAVDPGNYGYRLRGDSSDSAS